jgi:hypothetical protein
MNQKADKKITNMELLDVKTEMKKMEALFLKYKDAGALDSEPQRKYEYILDIAQGKREGKINFSHVDAEWWELYSSERERSGAAAAELTAQAKRVYNAIVMSRLVI